jgi:cyclase
MKKKRIIPIVLFRDGFVVQSKTFSEYRNLGNPYDSVRRLSEWGADEVCFIDIGTGGGGKLQRTDLGRVVIPTYLEVLEKLSETTSMPLSSGGQIRSLCDIADRLSRGADKVVISSAAFGDTDFLSRAIKTFGSQCITVSVDIRVQQGFYRIFVDNGKKLVEGSFDSWLEHFNQIEVGELLLTSIDRDGTKIGFDLNLVRYAAEKLHVPLIISGGAGKWEDFQQVLEIEGVDAVAAANVFQHTDQSVFLAHKHLYNRGVNVRKPQLLM